ncbi:MAG: hypothetical protein JWP69_573 [Flaviaesturariibacter sp.]|nr:hypothetical protein [Flaviaesturariibacter sp.]
MSKVKKMMMAACMLACLGLNLPAIAQEETEEVEGGAGSTCTLNAEGSCKCVALVSGSTVTGYKCQSGTSDAKCVC